MSTSIKRKFSQLQISERKKYDVNIESYESAQDVVNDCRINKVHDYNDMSTDTDIHSSFHGVDSYDEALELLANGYQPTVDKLQMALKMNRKGTEKRIKFENNVHGFAPIVPLALKGVPQSMINMTMKPIKCKVLDVYYDMGIPCGVHSDDIIKCGQQLLGIIIEMEKQGYRFNLYAMQGFCNEDGVDILTVKVKDANRPLDLKRISFPLTHPAFFRVIGFDWQSKSPISQYRGGGRGYALTTKFDSESGLKTVKNLIKKVFGDNALYISCNKLNDKNDKEKYLKGELTNDERKKDDDED